MSKNLKLMASKSNTVQSFVKRTSDILGPFPKRRRKESSDNIYDRNIHRPSSSSAHPDAPNNCNLSDRSIQKHWSTSSLDEEIKKLLHEKLVRQVVLGRPFETLQFHRRRLIKQLADWIGVFDEDDDFSSSKDENGRYRHELVSLLATTSKKYFIDVPSDNSEWTKLLNKWLKANTSGAVLSNRAVYRILAVDGFRGFKPKHLTFYLPEVLLPLRGEYKSHVRGIRNMYDFFDKNEKVSSLTGTDSACVVFLALLHWYERQMEDDLMKDDQIMFQVKQAKSWAEGYLQQHGEYYQDVKNVDQNLLEKLCKIYGEEFKTNESWKVIGRELLPKLNREKL